MINFGYNNFEVIDSYEIFMSKFNIDKLSFLEWGIDSTIFPPIETVASEWKLLKERIFNNDVTYIRGYGRDAHATQLYIELYKALIGNKNIKKDPTNNAIPLRLIQKLTGFKRNRDIFNYQVSHIWGHTKNVFMFEAPWNICFTPKIMDPFTGHEAKGPLTSEYKKLFLLRAKELYEPFISDYNSIMASLNVSQRIEEYCLSMHGKVDDKILLQFRDDARKELSLIE